MNWGVQTPTPTPTIPTLIMTITCCLFCVKPLLDQSVSASGREMLVIDECIGFEYIRITKCPALLFVSTRITKWRCTYTSSVKGLRSCHMAVLVLWWWWYHGWYCVHNRRFTAAITASIRSAVLMGICGNFNIDSAHSFIRQHIIMSL